MVVFCAKIEQRQDFCAQQWLLVEFFDDLAELVGWPITRIRERDKDAYARARAKRHPQPAADVLYPEVSCQIIEQAEYGNIECNAGDPYTHAGSVANSEGGQEVFADVTVATDVAGRVSRV